MEIRILGGTSIILHFSTKQDLLAKERFIFFIILWYFDLKKDDEVFTNLHSNYIVYFPWLM